MSLYAITFHAGRVYDLLTCPLPPEESSQVRKEHIIQFMNSKENKLSEHSEVLGHLSNAAEIMGILQHSEELDFIADDLRRVALHYEVKVKRIHLRAQIFEWVSVSGDPVVWRNYLATHLGNYRVSAFLSCDWWGAAHQAWGKVLDHFTVFGNLTKLKENFPSDSDELRQCEKAIDFEVWLYTKWYYKYNLARDNASYLTPTMSTYASFFSGSGSKIMSGGSFTAVPALSLSSMDKETIERD